MFISFVKKFEKVELRVIVWYVRFVSAVRNLRADQLLGTHFWASRSWTRFRQRDHPSHPIPIIA